MEQELFAPDADVLASFQRARQEQALLAVGRLPVLVTDVVWDELVLGPVLKAPHGIGSREADHRRQQAETMKQLLKGIASAPTEIAAGSSTASILARLQMVRPEGPGEDSVIALALSRPEVIPVLMDRPALARAIEEVPRRVLSIHGFLRVLERDHGVPRATGDAVSDYLQRARNFVAPLWWRAR